MKNKGTKKTFMKKCRRRCEQKIENYSIKNYDITNNNKQIYVRLLILIPNIKTCTLQHKQLENPN